MTAAITQTPGASTPGNSTNAAHELTVNCHALSRALQLTSHALLKGARRGLPVHRGVQLAVTSPATLTTTNGTEHALTLTTFDGQASVRAIVPVDSRRRGQDPVGNQSSSAETPASVVVDHAHLRASIKGLHRSTHVALSLTRAGVTITTPAGVFALLAVGNGRFEFLPPPVTNESPTGVDLFTVPASDLAAGVKAVSRSASTDQTLPILCGLNVVAAEGQPVTVSATDRYRYTRWSAGKTWNGPRPTDTAFTLPARPVAAVAAALPRHLGADAPVTLTVEANAGTEQGWATLRTGTGEVTATFAITNGEYPRVEALWPASTTHTVDVPARALADAVRQAAALQEPRRVIALSLTGEGLSVSTDPGEPTDVHQVVHVRAPGNSVSLNTPIGFNPAFLADALDCFPDTATISGTTLTGPWTVTDNGPIRVLLMPVKIPAHSTSG